MFSLGIRYLNGYSAATEVDDDHRAEWPPHPGRIFMALVAAHYACEPKPEEYALLQWLETLPPPEIYAPEFLSRTVVENYVPVNDKAVSRDKRTTCLQSAPGIVRTRAERFFVRAWLTEDTVWMTWQSEIDYKNQETLRRLCEKVTRIGHTSSLVQMWLATSPEKKSNWVPVDDNALINLRIVTVGTLKELERCKNAPAIEQYANLLVAAEDSGNKKEQKQAKAKIRQEFGNIAPFQFRPKLSFTQGYARPENDASEQITSSVFNPNLIVLRLKIQEGPFRWLDLLSFPAFVQGFRNALLSYSNDLSVQVREVMSGHSKNGAVLQKPHLAFIPMAYVNSEYADGHVLGVGLVLPLDTATTVRKELLKAVANVQKNGLALGILGKWSLESEIRELPPLALRESTWTASRKGHTHWSTVTPIVYEHHPKEKDKSSYLSEVAKMIKKSCSYIGLPEPREVLPSPVSALMGVPPSHAFPRLQRKDGSERRHIHAILVFDEPVCGPILLGAGRYRGYGVLRPMLEGV